MIKQILFGIIIIVLVFFAAVLLDYADVGDEAEPSDDGIPAPIEDGNKEENGDGENTEDGDSGILPPESGIMGVVVAGPQCPVIREGEDCPDKPIETVVSVYREGSGDLVVSYQTGRDGTFWFDLFPGDYVVRAAEDNALPSCTPQNVAVLPDKYANIQLQCDTGIR